MSQYEWPLDKAGVINSALSQCGDNLVATADNGSDEWNCASPAYERALAYMAENHSWSFATAIETLQPTGTAPDDPRYANEYELPSRLTHLIWVKLDDRAVIYDILEGRLILNANGGVVTIKFAAATNATPTLGTPTFVLALERFVMSGIYRGLHEDAAEAKSLRDEGRAILAEARTRYDMQKPKRAMFVSGLRTARFVRRPGGASGGLTG